MLKKCLLFLLIPFLLFSCKQKNSEKDSHLLLNSGKISQLLKDTVHINPSIDSLKTLLRKIPTDTQQVSIINSLAEEWISINPIVTKWMPIGRYYRMNPFILSDYQLIKGDTIYIATDGFADQFGGPNEKKFQKQNLMHLLNSISAENLSKQKEIINLSFEDWNGTKNQLDDITILGIRV